MAEGTEAEAGAAQVSEAQIAVHWREEDYYYPPESFIRQANANDPAIFERFAEENFPGCFTEYADLHRVQSAKLARGEVPRELTEAESEEIRSFGSE
jgi:hypothetical protein